MITKYGCRKTFTLSIHYLPWQIMGHWTSIGKVDLTFMVSHQHMAMNTFYTFLPSLCFCYIIVLTPFWQQQNRIPTGQVEL